MIKDVLNIGELPLIIKNHSLGTIFYYNQDKKYILKQRATHYIKILASLFLIDIKRYEFYIKKFTNIKYKIPLILDENTIFIRIKNERDFDHLWINYHEISHYSYLENQTHIHFKNGYQYAISTTQGELERYDEKIKAISSFIMKDKHQMFNEIHIKK